LLLRLFFSRPNIRFALQFAIASAPASPLPQFPRHRHQILLAGDSGTGKTTLLVRFHQDRFLGAASAPTVGVGYAVSAAAAIAAFADASEASAAFAASAGAAT